MDSKNNGPEINIKDLLFVLLRKIWILILAGIILGISLGGYKLSKRVKTYDVLDATTKINSSESDDEYQLRVQNINKARGYVDMISRVNSQIEYQRQYISDSIYMQIDSNNVCQSTALISISIDDSNAYGMENVILSSYEREIKASDEIEKYAKDQGVKPEYIKELISFSPFVPNNIIDDTNSNDRVAALNIYVIGPSTSFCNELMDIILQKIDSLYVDVCTSAASHHISIVGVQELVSIDENVRNFQNNQIAKIDNLQRQINTYNDSLDKIANALGVSGKDVIIEYFNTHVEEPVVGIPSSTSERNVSRRTMIKPAIKYFILGFLVGFCLIAFVFVVRYLFGKCICTQAQFFSEFKNINRIGVLKPINKRSKCCVFVDFKSGDDTKYSEEKNNKLILYNYENITKDYKNVLITGVGDSEAAETVIKTLGLKGDFKHNMFKNPEVIKSISQYDAVVLVEQRNVSMFVEIKKEIDLITNSGTEILGAIII